LPPTLIGIIVALATVAIALFVACHHCRHRPCRPRCRRRTPATLFTVAIALFVAVTVTVTVTSPPP
jgi:uncharacterized membrane protein YidH (DUF202 family)